MQQVGQCFFQELIKTNICDEIRGLSKNITQTSIEQGKTFHRQVPDIDVSTLFHDSIENRLTCCRFKKKINHQPQEDI